MYIIAYLFVGIICGIIGNQMGGTRQIGGNNGALLGFFLGVIGLVFVAISPVLQYES